MSKLTTLFLVTALCCGPSTAFAESYIWGPDAMKGGPAQSCGVFIHRGKIKGQTCSATVISEDMAITSAHCFMNVSFLNAYMKCGDEGKKYKIRRLQPNPDYETDAGTTPDRANDLMLVYLDKALEVDEDETDYSEKSTQGPFDLSRSKGSQAEEKFAPEPVPFGHFGVVDIPGENQDCLAAGWGRDKGASEGETGAPRYTKIYKLDYDPAWPKKNVIRFGFEGNSAGHGDSGGGLFCKYSGRYYLVGVITGGYGPGDILTAATSVMDRFK